MGVTDLLLVSCCLMVDEWRSFLRVSCLAHIVYSAVRRMVDMLALTNMTVTVHTLLLMIFRAKLTDLRALVIIIPRLVHLTSAENDGFVHCLSPLSIFITGGIMVEAVFIFKKVIILFPVLWVVLFHSLC